MSNRQTSIKLIETDTLYLLAITAFLGITLGISVHKSTPHPTTITMPVMQHFQNPLTLLQPLAKEAVTQISPDGTMKITLTAKINDNRSHTYTLVTSDVSDTTKQTIYSVTLPLSENLTIPFNAWSPDNTYFFIDHHYDDHTDALVFRADGQALSDTEKFLNVTNIYTRSNTGNIYDETTGWASNTLLILDTKQADGSSGTSYWVEIPSKAVIPLATQF